MSDTKMMIKLIGLNLFFLLYSFGLHASSDEERFLEVLIEENREVNGVYQQCLEALGDGRRDRVMGCVWDGHSPRNGVEIQGISDATKRDIIDALEQIRGGQEVRFRGVDLSKDLSDRDDNERSPASAEDQLYNRDAQAVANFFGDRIREKMFGIGGDAEKRLYVGDDSQFHNLYRTQLSKNVIEAISSFCMEAYPLINSNGIISFYRPGDHDQRKAIRERYLELLHIPIPNDPNDPEAQESEGEKTVAYHFWSACSIRIQPICEGRRMRIVSQDERDNIGENEIIRMMSDDPTNPNLHVLSGPDQACPLPRNVSPNFLLGISSDIDEALSRLNLTASNSEGRPPYNVNSCRGWDKHTRNFACSVVDMINSSRRSLEGLTRIEENWENLHKDGEICADQNCGNAAGMMGGSNYDFYRPDRAEGSDADSLTTMTSADTVGSEEYQAAINEMRDGIERCLEQGDEEMCQRFLEQDHERRLAEIDEYDLRTRAMQQKIEEIEEGDEQALEDYLKEEGYSDEQIALFMSDPEQIQQLITERYAQMRARLVDGMRNQLSLRSQKGEEFNFDDDKRTLESIQAEIEGRMARTRDIVHFNNVISGYLNITSGEGEDQTRSRNTASLIAERDRLYEDFEESRSALEEAIGDSGAGGDADSVELQTDTIFRYFIGY